MSENAAPAGMTADGVTAGSLLREAREAAGLHASTLAANLKVPVRKLEALEEDRYDLLPDAVFVRALASSICRSLKIDPQPVLERLPQSSQPRLPQEGDGIGAPFRAPSDGPGPGLLDHVSKPVALTVLALLLAALVLVFLPERRDAAPGGQAGTTDPVMPPPGASPLPAQAAAVPAESAASPAPGETTLAATPALAAPGASVAAVPPPNGSPPSSNGPAILAVTPAMALPAPAASAPAASGLVVFRTRGPSWIEVTDAAGATQLRRLLGPGESAGASGRLPLSVTIGDASQTDVQVRGKPYDLSAVARDNVARFEVK